MKPARVAALPVPRPRGEQSPTGIDQPLGRQPDPLGVPVLLLEREVAQRHVGAHPPVELREVVEPLHGRHPRHALDPVCRGAGVARLPAVAEPGQPGDVSGQGQVAAQARLPHGIPVPSGEGLALVAAFARPLGLRHEDRASAVRGDPLGALEERGAEAVPTVLGMDGEPDHRRVAVVAQGLDDLHRPHDGAVDDRAEGGPSLLGRPVELPQLGQGPDAAPVAEEVVLPGGVDADPLPGPLLGIGVEQLDGLDDGHRRSLAHPAGELNGVSVGPVPGGPARRKATVSTAPGERTAVRGTLEG